MTKSESIFLLKKIRSDIQNMSDYEFNNRIRTTGVESLLLEYDNRKLDYWGTCVDVNEGSDWPLHLLIDLDENGDRVNRIKFYKKVNVPNEIIDKTKLSELEYILYQPFNINNIDTVYGAIYDVDNDLHYLFW